MRRYFFGSSFGRAFRNEVKYFSTDSAAVSSSNAAETTTEGSLPTSAGKQECGDSLKRSVAANPTIAAMIEAAHAANISAATAVNAAANAIAHIRRVLALAGALDVHDEILSGGEVCAAARANDDSLRKLRLRNVLTEVHTRFQEIELKKDPNEREKLPWALPDVEIESDSIAGLSIEEPFIIFVATSFFGENGQGTGVSSRVLFYTDNKGSPLKLMLCRNLNGSKRTAGPHALEYTVRDVPKRLASCRYKIFSDHESAVKCVQERMMRLKAREVLSNNKYATIAKALIENDSTIEFIASERNVIAGFLAHIIGKVGHRLLDDNLPYDEVELIL